MTRYLGYIRTSGGNFFNFYVLAEWYKDRFGALESEAKQLFPSYGAFNLKSAGRNQIKEGAFYVIDLYPSDLMQNFDENGRVLVLGSFPSVQSRKAAFFYGHPQNRFWRVLSAVFGEPVPGDVPEKKALLLKHKVALWDVIASCDVTGSSDASIKNVVPNDLSVILSTANITHVCTNGQMAHKLYQNYLAKEIDLPETVLPSTSPANAAWSLERLTEAWKIIRSI